jgi:TIR domain/Sel1 repeat
VPAHEPAAFISYSRDDSEFALHLAQDLKAAGAFVWLDQLDIPAGHPWDNAIEDALSDAPQVLIVLSPSSARSDNVRNEISFALEQGKIIIPVLYMDCVVPLRLQRTQRIDFRADYARGLTALLGHLNVTRPDPSVLQKASEADAQRQTAWKARDAASQRLREIEESREREDTARRDHNAEQLRLQQVAEREASERRDREAEAARLRDEQRGRAEREAAELREAQTRSHSEANYRSDQGGARAEPSLAPWQQKRSKTPLILSAIIAVLVITLIYVLRPHPSEPSQSNSGENVEQSGASGNGQQANPSASSSVTNPVSPQETTATDQSAKVPSMKVVPLSKSDRIVTDQPVKTPPPNAANLYQQADTYYNRKDYVAAAPLFEQACNLGESKGCNAIGLLFENGEGVSRDIQKSAALYQKGCTGGNAAACSNLSRFYQNGIGVQRDSQKAALLDEVGCNGGSLEGCMGLGLLYETGSGVPKDLQKASVLYQKSCAGNISQGCRNIARLYELGYGMAQNVSMAKQFYQKACSLGDQVSCDTLKRALFQ